MRGTFCRAADVYREGHVIIRPLHRVKVVAAVPDGGSDATVTTAKPVVPAQAQRVKPVQLELSCRTGANGYQIVSVTGELDIATAEQAYSYISEVIDGRPAPVTVDLSGLTFCDASGLGALARIARHAREAGRQLMLASARPSLLKIMRITGLDRAFPELHPSAHAYSA
jgi:anti-sigma B factor antagonist